MAWFSGKYKAFYPPEFKEYKIIRERDASSITRRTQEKIEKELERNEKLQARWGRLSPDSQSANLRHLELLRDAKSRLSKVLEDPYTELYESRLLRSSRAKRGFAGAAISGILQRERKQSFQGFPQRARSSAKASAADRREFGPGPQVSRNPRTVYGTEAFTSVSSLGRRYFRSPVQASPCVKRLMRKQVMFASGHAPGAHRVPHRRNVLSSFWC